MKMTPIDIQQHQFRVKFRGFDVQEVDTFLDQMADAFGVLMDEQERLREEVDSLKTELQCRWVTKRKVRVAGILATDPGHQN